MATVEAQIKGSGDHNSVFGLNKDCGMGLVGFGTLQLWLESGQASRCLSLGSAGFSVALSSLGEVVWLRDGSYSAPVLILTALHDPFPEAWFLLDSM